MFEVMFFFGSSVIHLLKANFEVIFAQFLKTNAQNVCVVLNNNIHTDSFK